MQAALDSGRDVRIAYVYRSPENAAASAIERALEPNGRPVPVNELAKAHANSLKTVRALAEEFKNNPNFKVIAIDNNGKMEDVHITDINQIPEVNYVAAKRAFVAAVDAAWAGADAGRVRSDSGEGAQNGQPDAGRDGAVGGVQQHAGAAVRGGTEKGNPQQGADAVTGQPRQLTAALYKAFTGREPPARAARGTHASAQNAQAVVSRETAFDATQAGLSGAGATQDALTAAQVAGQDAQNVGQITAPTGQDAPATGQSAQNVGQSAPEVGQAPAPAAPTADLSEDARGMVEGGGAATRIITPDGRKLAAQWDVVEADSVQATMKEGVNQPRDRTRAASDAQVRAIARNPDFDRLSDTSQTMDYGAPTLTREGVIVAGNGRFEGVSGAYAGAPQAAAQYRAQLEENAQRFGLDAQRIRGMKKPVLVRRVTQDADTRQLAVQSNQPAGLRMSDMEQAALDAERMGANLADLHIHEDGSIAPTQHNHEVIARALGGYTTEEAGEFMAADGGLSQAGLRRVRNAILYRAYGKSDVLTRLLEAPDADMRNVGTALLRAAGSLAENRRAMDENHIPAEYDIAADLEAAIAALSRIRASGQHVESFLAQSDWVGGGLSESGRTILRMVSENLRSAKAITQFLREYAARVQSLQNTSGGLFGDMPRPGKQEVLEDVKRRFDEQRNLARGQNDLFGQPADSARGDGGTATADGQDAKPAGVAGDARGAGSGAQAGADGRGVSGQQQGVVARILGLVRAALANKRGGNKAFVDFAPVTAQVAARVKENAGLEVSGYVHLLDESGARHIHDEHGNPETEAARGQIAITEEDFARLPQIVSAPDDVYAGETLADGTPTVIFKKRMEDGTVCYVQEVRTGRKKLAAKNLWKTRSVPLAATEAGEAHTSETLTRSTSTGADSVAQSGAVVAENATAARETSSGTDGGQNVPSVFDKNQTEGATFSETETVAPARMWESMGEEGRARLVGSYYAYMTEDKEAAREEVRRIASTRFGQFAARFQRALAAKMLLGLHPSLRRGMDVDSLAVISRGHEPQGLREKFDALFGPFVQTEAATDDAAFWTQGTDASASSGADIKTQSNTEAPNNQGVTGETGENGGRESNTAKTEEQSAKTEEQPTPSDWVGLTFAQAAEDWDGRGEAQRVKVLASALRKNEMDLRSRMKTGRKSFAELDPALQRRVAAAMSLLRDKAERNGATVKQLMAQRAGKDLPQTPEARGKTEKQAREEREDARDAETGTSGGVIPGNGQNVEQDAAQGANLNQAEAVRKGNGQNLNQEAGEDTRTPEERHAEEVASGRTVLDFHAWQKARSPQFKEWFGGDWETLHDLTVPEAATEEYALEELGKLAGRPLVNDDTGDIAYINGGQRRKIVSAVARAKSITNLKDEMDASEAVARHYAMAARIAELWKHAVYIGEFKDGNKEPGMHIYRFAVAVRQGGRVQYATILAKFDEKRQKDGSRRAYTLELHEEKTLQSMLDSLANERIKPQGAGVPVRSAEEILRATGEKINPPFLSQTNPTTGEPWGEIVKFGGQGERELAMPYAHRPLLQPEGRHEWQEYVREMRMALGEYKPIGGESMEEMFMKGDREARALFDEVYKKLAESGRVVPPGVRDRKLFNLAAELHHSNKAEQDALFAQVMAASQARQDRSKAAKFWDDALPQEREDMLTAALPNGSPRFKEFLAMPWEQVRAQLSPVSLVKGWRAMKAPQAAASTQRQGRTQKGIGNFGERISDNSKRVRLINYGSLTDIAERALSDIWPLDSVREIEDTFLAAVSHAARAAIPAKPKNEYKVGVWAEHVRDALRMAKDAARLELDVDGFRQYAGHGKFYFMDNVADKVELLTSIDRAFWGGVEEVRLFKGETGIDARVRLSGSRERQSIQGKDIADIASQVSDRLAAHLAKEKPRGKRDVSFEVVRARGKTIIQARGSYAALKEFEGATQEVEREAQAYIDAHHDELLAEWERFNTRDGRDVREGKDATPEMFSQAFGFRGVEFGRATGQKERQTLLNRAFDALHDLADLLGVPTQALSLNGSLGLAFGSRGRGNANAHFEPDSLVINLTRERGAGTLAHEWFHALDNYFSRMRGVRYGSMTKMKEGDAAGNVRAEMVKAFNKLVMALNASPMAKRSRELDDSLGTRRYFTRPEERAARAFENYVIAKMQAQGIRNNYLAYVLPEYRSREGQYPYLLAEEAAPIEKAFDNLFAKVKTKQTDKGVALFARRQLLAQATMQREAYTLEDARSIARREFVGHKLTNAATGQKATLSASNLRKMTSEKAHKKSANARAHAMAVANADALFEAALLDHSHEDKNGEPTIAAIHRFVAPMVFDGRVFAVKMTVKETTSEKNPNPIYSIEAIDVENPPSVLSRAEPDATGIRPRAGFSEKVLERLAEVKRALSDTASRRTDFAREEAAGAPSRGRFALAAGGVRRVVRQALQGVRNAPRVEVVETVADLPFAAPSDAQGAFHNGRVWLVAENLKSAQEAREVLAHEMIGHYGLRGFFGRGLDMVLNRIHANNARVRQMALQWRRDNADLIRTLEARGVSREAIRARSIEEALAQMAQAGEKLTGWKMLAGFVQNLLRKMGAHRWANMLEARTDAEALTALKQAEMFVRDGLTANDTIPNGALAAFERAVGMDLSVRSFVEWARFSREARNAETGEPRKPKRRTLAEQSAIFQARLDETKFDKNSYLNGIATVLDARGNTRDVPVTCPGFTLNLGIAKNGTWLVRGEDGQYWREATAKDLRDEVRESAASAISSIYEAEMRQWQRDHDIWRAAQLGKRLGLSARIVTPSDSSSRYVYLTREDGAQLKVRAADHAQPVEGGRVVGGFDSSLGKRHSASHISIDPVSGALLEDALRLVREFAAGADVALQNDGYAAPVKQLLQELLDAARADGNENRTVDLGVVRQEHVALMREQGLPVFGNERHTADIYAVRYVQGQHTNESREESFGQLPVTDDDVRAIDEVVRAPDAMVFRTKGKGKTQTFAFIKQMPDGTILYIEELRTGRGTLALKDMRKFPAIGERNNPAASDVKAIAHGLLPTNAQSDGGAVEIVPLSDAFRQVMGADAGAAFSFAGERGAAALDGERNLVITHNLTAANLLHAVKMGGLPVPSLAVTTKDNPVQGFGEITLIGDGALADPRGAAGTRVYGADIYSPRYPRVSHQINDKALKSLRERVAGMREVVGRGSDQLVTGFEFESDPRKHIESDIAVMGQFLRDNRVEPEIVRYENGRVDSFRTENAMRQQMEKAALSDKYQEHVDALVGELVEGERIFQGYTNSGRRRYILHTLENVVKILKKELRGGEGFNYGAGSLRAKFTPQFRTIEQIRKAKGRLVSKADFEKVSDEIDKELLNIASAISPDIRIETAMWILEDAPKMGAKRSAAEAGYNISDETEARINEFLEKLKNLPTQYFEAKILRAVQLSEFSGAVVPDGTDKKVLDALKAAGITDIRTYKKGDETARARAVAGFEDVMFSRAGREGEPAGNSGGLALNARKAARQERKRFFGGRSIEQLMRDYDALPDADGGHVINADIARTLSPQYRDGSASADDVQNAVSELADRLFKRDTARPVAAGREALVVFTAGGSGAGKSAAVAKLITTAQKADIVFDGTFSDADRSVARVKRALASGRGVEIRFVYRTPANAAESVIKRANETRRTVPMEKLVKSHVQSLQTVKQVLRECADAVKHEKLSVTAIDNNGARIEDARVFESIDQVPEETQDAVREQFKQALVAARAAWAGSDDGRVQRAGSQEPQDGRPDEGRAGNAARIPRHESATVSASSQRRGAREVADTVSSTLSPALYDEFMRGVQDAPLFARGHSGQSGTLAVDAAQVRRAPPRALPLHSAACRCSTMSCRRVWPLYSLASRR